MTKSIIRTYSRYTRDAVLLLGRLIRKARKRKKYTEQEAATRAGISRGLLQRIEKGNLKCEIGVVFELAAIVGVKLFDLERTTLTKHLQQTEEILTLLPRSIRQSKQDVDDDF